MHSIEITHNFETAHRLSHPNAPIKCRSIHGHSWLAKVTLTATHLDDKGMVLEFGAFKKAWRALLNDELDHHLVVQHNDPVAKAIVAIQPEARILWLSQDPSTEYLAQWIHERTTELVHMLGADHVHVARVHVQETRVNAASYEAP